MRLHGNRKEEARDCFAARERKMEEIRVKVKEGILSGRTDGEVAVFMGVPYAAPPVGDLRWRGPQPAEPWDGVREAVECAPMAVQIPIPGSLMEKHEMSEDCLYLNIWAPDDMSGKHAVLVWFYGGALQGGCADVPSLSGKAYARDGVVLVTVSYRVGVFGFMCHPDMKGEDPDGFVGNFGHRDQMAALKWIRENISQFGGDPDRVTISGQSAGSASCCALMNAPAAKGLFHAAILHSGDVFQPERDVPLSSAESWGEQLAAKFGCSTLDEFRKVPVDVLYADGDPMMKHMHQFAAAVIDGAFLPESQGDLLLNDRCYGVPVIIGTNLDEGSRFAAEQYIPAITSRLGIPENLYDAEPDIDHKANALARDYWYARHLVWARIRSREYGLPSWEYVFARRLTAQGAFHGMEIPYTFSTLDAEPDFGKPLPYTSDDRQLSALMHSYWVNFIKKFDPNGGGLPFWPEKSQGDLHMQFDAVSEVRDDIIRDTDRTVTPAVDQWMRSRIRN